MPGAVSGPHIVRFERRLKDPGCKSLAKLAQLENPFAGFVLTTTLPQAPHDGPAYVWPLFCDSVGVRGLHAALQLLPEHKRPIYKKQFASTAPGWWNPDAIWRSGRRWSTNRRSATRRLGPGCLVLALFS
jgi:hypothetical protein